MGVRALRTHQAEVAGHEMFECLVDGDAERLWNLMTPALREQFTENYGGRDGASRFIRANSQTYNDLIAYHAVWCVLFRDEATVTMELERPGLVGNVKSQLFIKVVNQDGRWLLKGARPQ